MFGKEMARRFVVPAQAALVVCGGVMCLWINLPWWLIGALGILGLAVVTGSGRRLESRCVGIGWVLTALMSTRFVKGVFDDSGLYYAVVAWLMAAAILPKGCGQVPRVSSRGWGVLAAAWAGVGGLLWTGSAYAENRSATFYAGIGFCLAWILACKRWFRLPLPAVLAANTLILLLAGVPLVDWFTRPAAGPVIQPSLAARYYSYEVARQDPTAFARWWECFSGEWQRLFKTILMPDPDGHLPYRLRPNSRGKLFESSISINSRGLRGPEIPEKTNQYRILALGESTTFGSTLARDDTPWPNLLEKLIRQGIASTREVEVLNAGVPGLDLAHNLYRLTNDLLELKPDLIISYHGYNGFHLLNDALPLTHGKRPPTYHPRPLWLLAAVEHRARLSFYRRRLRVRQDFDAASRRDPMTTKYAAAYRELIRVAQAAHIRLVLANFSMAVDGHSDAAVVGFYQAGFPSARFQIEANRIHSLLLRTLASEHPEVAFVDTQMHLDGKHERFVDLVHLTQAGRAQLSENLFTGMRPLLENELAAVRPSRGPAEQPASGP